MTNWLTGCSRKWAFNIFETDWLWALHESGNPYWEQNHNIVAHAWEKWRKQRDGAWLQIAISRVHPRDPLAEEILLTALPFRVKPWKRETREYRQWFFKLWENSIRIRLGQNQYVEAFELMKAHSDLDGLFEYREISYPSSVGTPSQIAQKMLRWLVYTGQVDAAREFLDLLLKRYPESFGYWQTLLARNTSEAMVVAREQRYSSHGYADSAILWQEMISDLPAKVLLDFASDSLVDAKIRAVLSRAALTRAILLEKDSTTIDKYAVLAGKLNPEIREQVLQAVALHDRNRYVSFLLSMPRFRPTPYLEYLQEFGRPGEGKRDNDLFSIDRFNHNDNNWWCRFDHLDIERRIWGAAQIVPVFNPIFEAAKGEEFDVYVDKQRDLLAKHPYRALVDAQEVQALEAIPAAPQYFSEAVNAREQAEINLAGLDIEAKNERARDLHRAVRTTRYGCNRNGSHETYSKQSFRFLHDRYGDTVWSQATPYWFK